MKKYIKTLTIILALVLTIFVSPIKVSAHCPLCTMAAGATAMGASVLGVDDIVIGIFMGAFASAMALWFARSITRRKKLVPKQYTILAIVIFLSTLIPVTPFMENYSSVYVSLSGDYGSYLNRTYIMNNFLIGGFIGGIMMLISPLISKKLTELLNGKHINYQGILVTFSFLFTLAIIFQFII